MVLEVLEVGGGVNGVFGEFGVDVVFFVLFLGILL